MGFPGIEQNNKVTTSESNPISTQTISWLGRRDSYENGRHYQGRDLPHIIITTAINDNARHMTSAHLQKMDEAKLFTYHQFHLGKGTILLHNKKYNERNSKKIWGT